MISNGSLWLGIALQAIQLITAILTIWLAHKWKDGRTRRHKIGRGVLIGVLILFAIASAGKMVLDERQSELTADKSARAVARLQSQLAETNTKLDQFKPLLEEVLQRYPGIDTSMAIEKLREELKKTTSQLEQKIQSASMEAATQGLFRPVSDALKKKLIQNFKQLGQQLIDCKIQVLIQGGEPARSSLSREIDALFKEAGLAAQVTNSTVVGFTPYDAVLLTAHANDTELAKLLVASFRPLISQEIRIYPPNDHVSGSEKPKTVVLWIFGKLVFGTDGSVVVE